jgi:hypothetical protein
LNLPVPDDCLGFRDLLYYAANYTPSVSAPQRLAQVVSVSGVDEVTVEAASVARAGETISASLRVNGVGDIQGLSAQLDWDRAVVTPVSVAAGDLITSQNGVVFSAEAGNVDAALLGTRTAGDGMRGSGVVATVTFRVLAAGNPAIKLAKAEATDAATRSINLRVAGVATVVAESGLFAARPNPFGSSTSMVFGMAQRGHGELAIYSVDGRRVTTLARGTFEPGMHSASWNGTDERGMRVKAGVYYARFTTGTAQYTKTIIFVK